MTRIMPGLALLLAGLVGATNAPPRSAHLRTSFCRDSDAMTTSILRDVRDMASTSDTLEARLRDSYSLSAMPVDSVRLVTDSALCGRAWTTLRRSRFGADTGALRRMILIKYGSLRYVGTSLEPHPNSEWDELVVFDTSFTALKAFTF
jgi:hypothetical protein